MAKDCLGGTLTTAVLNIGIKGEPWSLSNNHQEEHALIIRYPFRYENEREYEWLAAPPDILPLLEPALQNLPKNPRILQVTTN